MLPPRNEVRRTMWKGLASSKMFLKKTPFSWLEFLRKVSGQWPMPSHCFTETQKSSKSYPLILTWFFSEAFLWAILVCCHCIHIAMEPEEAFSDGFWQNFFKFTLQNTRAYKPSFDKYYIEFISALHLVTRPSIFFFWLRTHHLRIKHIVAEFQ